MFENLKIDDIIWDNVSMVSGQRKIKDCPGIAKQVRGKVVYVEPHPKFKGAWRFEVNGETWVGSDWGFED